jgi:hypothetical protein
MSLKAMKHQGRRRRNAVDKREFYVKSQEITVIDNNSTTTKLHDYLL